MIQLYFLLYFTYGIFSFQYSIDLLKNENIILHC
jgi:hypothetical protein